MRIAHVSDCYLPRVGGIEMHVRDLACRQLAAGHEVEVITATPPIPGKAPVGIGLPAVRRLCPDVASPTLRTLRAAAGVAAAVNAGGYDVVHVHASIASPVAVAAAHAAGRNEIPVVVTMHSVITGYGALVGSIASLIRIGSLPIIWSAVSETAAQPLARMLGGRREVAVLPNAIDLSQWQLPAAVPEPGDPVVIASVMRLAGRKRPLPLVRMLARVRAAVPGDVAMEAVIVGDGPQHAKVAAYLRRHDMAGWVRLTGVLPRADIAALFSRTGVYVAPASLESFGIAALEARSAGVPVLASTRGGVAEIIAHGEEGLLAGSDDDMVDQLTRLVRDRELRCSLAAHNRRIPTRYTWEETWQRTEELYHQALGVVGHSVDAVTAEEEPEEDVLPTSA